MGEKITRKFGLTLQHQVRYLTGLNISIDKNQQERHITGK
jgi:hypothetical protein